MEYKCHYCSYESDNETCPLCRRPVTKDITGRNTPAKLIPALEVAPGPPDIKIGRTLVTAWTRRVDERTGKETVARLHEGIAVQDCNGHTARFIRVFNPGPIDKGGDVSPEKSELFAFQAPKVWIEITGERPTAWPTPFLN